MIVAWLSIALGAEVIPWAAPWDVQDRYDRWRASRGEAPAALACDALWDRAARVCFREVVGDRLRRVHLDGAPPVRALRRQAEADAASWVRAELETVPVQGMAASYRLLRDARGRAVYGALAPDVLASEVGLPLLVALPSSSFLLAWRGGDPDVDKAMAVGVVELYQQATDPVTPVIFAWDGTRWFAFGEARPVPEGAGEKAPTAGGQSGPPVEPMGLEPTTSRMPF